MSMLARYPDLWASRRTGQSFHPGRIVSGERAAWVLDSPLPVLVAIDPATNSPGDPVPLPSPHRGWLDNSGLAAGGGVVWVAWSTGLVRVEERSRAATVVPVPSGVGVSRLAVGGGAAWVLAGGAILRVDPEGRRVEEFLPKGTRRVGLGFGGEHLWTLEQPQPSERRSVVTRHSPETGEATGEAWVEGVQSMTVNDAGVWLGALRWELPYFRGPMHKFLIRADPVSMDVLEHEIPSDQTFFLLGDEVWLGPHTLSPSSSGDARTELRRIDVSTWKPTAVVEVPGLLTDLSVGPAGLWGLLSVPAGGLKRVARVDAEAGRVVDVLDLAEIDARPFLPPPPDPLEPEPIERELCDELAGLLRNEHGTMPHVRGTIFESVAFEEVRLEGSFPHTEVVILFRTRYRPELLFGRGERIWSDEGVYEGDGAIISMNLEEDIIFQPSLPVDGQPDQTGTIWM